MIERLVILCSCCIILIRFIVILVHDEDVFMILLLPEVFISIWLFLSTYSDYIFFRDCCILLNELNWARGFAYDWNFSCANLGPEAIFWRNGSLGGFDASLALLSLAKRLESQRRDNSTVVGD